MAQIVHIKAAVANHIALEYHLAALISAKARGACAPVVNLEGAHE